MTGAIADNLLARRKGIRITQYNTVLTEESKLLQTICESHDIIISTINNEALNLKLMETISKRCRALFVTYCDNFDISLFSFAHFPRLGAEITRYQKMIELTKKQAGVGSDHPFLEVPYSPTQCIVWTQAIIDEITVRSYEELLEFLKGYANYFKKCEDELQSASCSSSRKFLLMQVIEMVKLLYSDMYPINFEDCISMAIKYFQYYFDQLVREVEQKYPVNLLDGAGNPFWANNRKFPDHLLILRPTLRPEVRQFIQGTAIIIGKILGVGIPPEDKIELSLNFKLEKYKEEVIDVQSNSPFSTYIEAVKNRTLKTIDLLRKKASAGPGASSIFQIPRVVVLIEYKSRGKEYRTELLTFFDAAVNLRSANFRLASVPKYNIERAIFDIKISLDSLSSMAAAITVLEILKYFSNQIAVSEFVPRFLVDKGLVGYEPLLHASNGTSKPSG